MSKPCLAIEISDKTLYIAAFYPSEGWYGNKFTVGVPPLKGEIEV